MSTAVAEFQPRRAVRRPRTSTVRRPVTPQVRLTRRGRLVLFLGGVLLALGGFVVVGGPAASTGEEHHQRTETVVVTSGVTLWDIAEDVAPGADPRALIEEIVELNGLPDAGAIRVGQPLLVPVD